MVQGLGALHSFWYLIVEVLHFAGCEGVCCLMLFDKAARSSVQLKNHEPFRLA